MNEQQPNSLGHEWNDSAVKHSELRESVEIRAYVTEMSLDLK